MLTKDTEAYHHITYSMCIKAPYKLIRTKHACLLNGNICLLTKDLTTSSRLANYALVSYIQATDLVIRGHR